MSQQVGQHSGLLPLDGSLYMQAFWNTHVETIPCCRMLADQRAQSPDAPVSCPLA